LSITVYYLVQYTQFCRYPGIGAYNRPTIVQFDLNLQVHFEGNEVVGLIMFKLLENRL